MLAPHDFRVQAHEDYELQNERVADAAHTDGEGVVARVRQLACVQCRCCSNALHQHVEQQRERRDDHVPVVTNVC